MRIRRRPDLALLEVLPPDANGSEIALAKRRELARGQTVMISSEAATVDLPSEQARQDGNAFEVLAKPFAPDDAAAHGPAAPLRRKRAALNALARSGRGYERKSLVPSPRRRC